MTQQEKMEKLQKSFAFPRMMKMAGLRNWPNTHVPVLAQVNEFIPEICRVPYDYLFRDDPVAMAECMLLVWEYLGLDQLNGNLDIYNFEAEATGAKLRFYKDHIPDVDRSELFIQSHEDLKKIHYDGITAGRTQYLIDYVKAVANYIGNESCPNLSAPWSLAANLYGLENLVMDAIEDPDFVYELLHTIIEKLMVPMYKTIHNELDCPFSVGGADAMAIPPMVSPDMIDEFNTDCHQYMKRLLGEGVPVSIGLFTNCRILSKEDCDKMLETSIKLFGGTGLSVFDPDPAEMGVEYFRKFADEKKVMLMLGVYSPLLLNGTKEEILERVKKYTLEGKNGITPLMMFLSNIAPRTPLENIFTAIKAVHVYGAPGADWDTPFEYPEEPEPFEAFLKRKMENNTEGYTFKWLEKSELKL